MDHCILFVTLVHLFLLGNFAKGYPPTNPTAATRRVTGQAPNPSLHPAAPLLPVAVNLDVSNSSLSQSPNSSSSNGNLSSSAKSFPIQQQRVIFEAERCFDDSCYDYGGPTTCRCDNLCLSFGDCCNDFTLPEVTDVNRTVGPTAVSDVINVDVWQCVNNSFLPLLYPELRHGYRMIVRCPKEWPSDEVRQSCENSSSSLDQFLYVAEDTYYSNYHCAICNGANESLLSVIHGSEFCSWQTNTLLECISVLELDTLANASRSNNGTIALSPVNVQEIPKPRLCLQGVEEHCENETGSSYDANTCRYRYAPVIYNGVITKHSSCTKCNSNADLMCRIEIAMMDVGTGMGIFGIVEVFQQIVIADSMFGTQLQCVAGLEHNDYGRCVPVPTSWPKCDAIGTQLEQRHGTPECLRDMFCSFEETQGGNTFEVDVKRPCFELSHVEDGNLIFYLKYDLDAIPPVEAIEDVLLTVFRNQTDNRCGYVEIFVDQVCSLATTAENATVCYDELFMGHPNEFQPTFVHNESLVFFNQTFIQPIWWRNETSVFYNQSEIISEPRFVLCGVEKVTQTCPTLVVTNASVEWFLLGNDTSIRYQDTTYHSDEYVLYPDGRISICFIAEESESSQLILTIVGHVAFGISSACIFATFITYLSFSVLRNRQGIAIMNFLVALFFGQILLQYVGHQLSDWYLPCIVVAALSHFFFLASFVWTTVLAWDLSRSFSFSSLKSFTSQSCGRRMALYLLVGWGVPLIFVCTTLILQFSNLWTLILIEYGGPACWFTDRFASVALFFAPISLCLLINFFLFIVTVHGVHSTKKMTSILREGQKSSLKQQLMELRIYIKISALLGFTWMSGFLAMVVNIPAMWYVFVIISGLQGVFIFISFGINKRARRLWNTSTENLTIWRTLTRKDYSKSSISGSGRNTRSGSGSKL